ncbi:MAG: peptidoglycan editing factor PgeF [Deltaproteobacteria bacterium]
MLKENLGIAYASSPLLKGIDSMRHGFLTRLGGVSKGRFSSLNFDIRDGDDIENVEQNKAVAGRVFCFEPIGLLTVNQVHGNDILAIEKPAKDLSALSKTDADAIITNQGGLAIGVLTADCVPIILADHVKKIIGIVHAGWKGTVNGIVKKAIDAMIIKFGSDRKTIIAAIGPSIGPCCYKVDDVVAKEFVERFSDYKDFITPLHPPLSKGGRGDSGWRLDLKKANLNQMLDSGILEKNISVEDLCTSCRNDLFFSYRKDGKITGRQFNFIMLKGS